MNKSVSGNKTIAKNSLYLYARMIILMLISLLSVRLVLNSIGVEGYGVYSAVAGVVLSFSFLSQTLVSASQRFFSVDLGLNDSDGFRESYKSVIISYLIISILILLLLETIGLWFVNNKLVIPDGSRHLVSVIYQISIATFLVNIFVNPYVAILISHEDIRIYSFITLIESVLKLTIALLLSKFSDRLLWYVILLLLLSVTIFFVYFTVCKHRYKSLLSLKNVQTSKLSSVLKYSSWTLFGTMANVANTQGVNLLLNVFFGPIANAAYSLGYQVSGIVNQVTTSFYSAVRPPLTKSYAIKDFDRTYNLFYFSSKVLYILLIIIVIPLQILMPELLQIWLGEVGDYTVIFSKLLITYVLIISLSNPITTIVQAAGLVKLYHGIVDTFSLIALPLSYLAYKMGFQPSIAFVISNIIFIIAHLIRLLILKKCMTFSIREYILKFICPAILVLLISYTIANFSSYIFQSCVPKILVVGLTSIIVILITSYLFLLSKSDRSSIIAFLKSKFKSNY